MNRRCTRGHFIPATAETSVCRCTLTPRRRLRRKHVLGADLWGQGLAARRKCIADIPLTGRYL
ncbi:hypothetical protein DMA15_17495 [Streptomyces sp. WAC 01529]|uniref:hypothetical protein n=1 Tax=Streptomyces sp. WAC 01529 TaxID=2203205 RepID=UPI000F714424|nr:hypothetical protein [Streptomyces sp. WAC 01529]AZM54143.1 hypothetical protein DMA15_17495 [Streptomyces sp. WAC 01529]